MIEHTKHGTYQKVYVVLVQYPNGSMFVDSVFDEQEHAYERVGSLAIQNEGVTVNITTKRVFA